MRHQIGRDGLPEREALFELGLIEDGLDGVRVGVVGAVGLERIRGEVRGGRTIRVRVYSRRFS
jgi:hypothetical protein